VAAPALRWVPAPRIEEEGPSQVPVEYVDWRNYVSTYSWTEDEVGNPPTYNGVPISYQERLDGHRAKSMGKLADQMDKVMWSTPKDFNIADYIVKGETPTPDRFVIPPRPASSRRRLFGLV
jgi:hypothetical protein